MRKMPNSLTEEQTESVIGLRKQGFGIRVISARVGRQKQTVKRLLQELGLYSERMKHTAGIWAWRTGEIKEDQRLWKDAERWWYEAHHKPLTAMERYYSDHEASKKAWAARAMARYARLKHTPEWKLKQATRNAVSRIARMVGTRRPPKSRTFEYLGCDYDTARKHLEAQFKPSMTWKNHGLVWEIDHIKPLAAFNLMDETERKAASHYTNLQPLNKLENRMKSDKYDGGGVKDTKTSVKWR